MIKYFLIPLFILFPEIPGIHQRLIELLLIPNELTESPSGVGPPNAELIAYILENLFNLALWLLFNAFIALKLAKVISRVKYNILFYQIFFILTMFYIFLMYNFTVQNYYYFKIFHMMLILILVQYFWRYRADGR